MTKTNGKIIKINLNSQIRLSEVVVAQDEKGKSIRRVDSEGHSCGVDQHSTGLTQTIAGRTAKNEEGTPETFRILMEKMNQQGGSWDLEKPEEHEEGIDGRLRNRQNKNDTLDIQVTKRDDKIWKKLALRPEGITCITDFDAVCELLVESIERKRHVSKSPCLVLALEAVYFPVTIGVAEHFKENYAAGARSVGFAQVWLVGPTPASTFRLV